MDHMKWVEIITLHTSGSTNRQFVDELLKLAPDSDSPTDTPHLLEIRTYHHSVVETDLSTHIYWKSEPERQDRSPLGVAAQVTTTKRFAGDSSGGIKWPTAK
jgi:hypothetical protein